MDETYGATRGPGRFSGRISTMELEDFTQEFECWCDQQSLKNPDGISAFIAWKALFSHLEGAPMDDWREFAQDHVVEIEQWRAYYSPDYVPLTLGGHKVAAGKTSSKEPYRTSQVRREAVEKGDTTSTSTVAMPSFNPIVKFFKVLEKSYQRVRVDKLKSLQEFQWKSGENLREAYSWMRRLIVATRGMTAAQSVQFWYAMLLPELRNRVRSSMLLKLKTPTLKAIFELAELVELNIVEKQVSAIAPMSKSAFASHAQKGASVGKTSKPKKPSNGRVIPSYIGQTSSDEACYKCGGYGHIARDCPKKGHEGSPSGQQDVVECDNCGKRGHTRDRCFQLFPELCTQAQANREQ
jgi:hypothetical protein